MISLAAQLFREVNPGFIRVLASAGAPVYIDVLDALEREASERHEGMSREEALAIITEVLTRHPSFLPDETEVQGESQEFARLPAREKARRVLEHLARPEVGWILDEQLPNWERVVRFDAHGITLLDALRRIARPEAAVFTDKLQGVCAALANEGAFADSPLAHLDNCLTLARGGLSELRGIEKSLKRLTRRQREAATLGDVYGVVFNEYAEQVGGTCYAELVRSQLPARLDDARERIRKLFTNPDLLHKMQHEVMRRDQGEPATAMACVRNRLAELARALELVQPLADEIDRRTAEFARRSLARSRYLQEIVGERRSQVKNLFEHINQRHHGSRLSDLNDATALPGLQLPEAKLLAGRDSLLPPSYRRSLEENPPVDDDVSEDERNRAKAQLGNVVRDSLTVSRANRLVQKLAGGKGARISSASIPIGNQDDLADVIALLLHAEASEAIYRVEVPRTASDLSLPQFDEKLNWRLEQFFIIKK
ncbi:MAG: Wadjet anti-phage system protein JetA family protein [Limisphaerales bacterium]